jgi:hypothetical protein
MEGGYTMKKLLSVVLSLLLLITAFSGCAAVAFRDEVDEDHQGGIGETASAAPEQQEQTKIAEYSYQYTNMKLELPDDWEYKILEGSEEQSVNSFGIQFWPKAQPSMTIRLLYHVNGIGLCGTGVTFEDVLLENGLTATKCTENIDKDRWFFLIYQDVPGAYAAECSASQGLWNEYGDAVMSILGSAEIGKNILSESEAIEAAKEGYAAAYDTVRAYFDHGSGTWEIHFRTENSGEDQIVRIGAQGDRL